MSSFTNNRKMGVYYPEVHMMHPRGDDFVVYLNADYHINFTHKLAMRMMDLDINDL